MSNLELSAGSAQLLLARMLMALKVTIGVSRDGARALDNLYKLHNSRVKLGFCPV